MSRSEKQRARPAYWAAHTGLFLALLVVAQIATRPLGSSLVTGSLVNLILILSVLLFGLASAATLCVLAPIFARLIGIGPLWPIVPAIIIGNLVLVIVWHFFNTRPRPGVLATKRIRKINPYLILALICGAVLKFAVLYFSVVKLLVPLILLIPEPQAGIISIVYSWPQLITAAIGGLLALAILPAIKKIARTGKRTL